MVQLWRMSDAANKVENIQRMKHRSCWQRAGVSWLLCLFLAVTSFAQEDSAGANPPPLSWNVLPIDNSAQLLTLFFRSPELDGSDEATDEGLPLLSVVRDTLGSSDTAVHRLRYIWLYTYTVPSLRQRMAAGIPFLYSRLGNAPASPEGVPRSLMDLSGTNRPLWEYLRSGALKLMPAYPTPPLLMTSFETYNRNQTRYRNAQVSRAATVLDLYDAADFESPIVSAEEMREIRARLSQSQSIASQFLGPARLEQMYMREMDAMRLACAGNWELLRQRAEAEGLIFDPLLLPDGTATHALLWIAKGDLSDKRAKAFNGRFLSIADPWSDEKLLKWNGITETRYFDDENRRVDAITPGAKVAELIPLALYGLDHPKIPVLLIDFRQPLNAKHRELSARAKDATAAALAPVSLLTKFVNASVQFVTRRKGTDLFQPTRYESYSQLKMLLSMDSALSPQLRAEVARRMEWISDNPLENDLKTELQLAQNQYQALLAYVGQPDGLTARLDLDRRAELKAGSHKGFAKALFKVTEVATLGLYTHRAAEHPELQSQLEDQRRKDSHVQFLKEVIKSSSTIEIEWDPAKVRDSLRYVSRSRALAEEDVARLALQIFERTEDEETRRACLDAVRQLDTGVAQAAFTKLLGTRDLEDRWREALTNQYLNAADVNQAAAPPPIQSASGGGAN
jgi:hypothetical protein